MGVVFCCASRLCDRQQSAQTCIECGELDMPSDRLISHRLFGELQPVARVKSDMRQSIA